MLGLNIAVDGLYRDALLWIISNQLGRRNLNDFRRGELVLKRKDVLARKAKENQLAGLKHFTVSANLPERSEPIDTRAELATLAGVGQRTLDKIEHIIEDGTREL